MGESSTAGFELKRGPNYWSWGSQRTKVLWSFLLEILENLSARGFDSRIEFNRGSLSGFRATLWGDVLLFHIGLSRLLPESWLCNPKLGLVDLKVCQRRVLIGSLEPGPRPLVPLSRRFKY